MKVVNVVMKVDDEISDEGGEWLILSCLRGLENELTDGRTFVNVESSATEKVHIKGNSYSFFRAISGGGWG